MKEGLKQIPQLVLAYGEGEGCAAAVYADASATSLLVLLTRLLLLWRRCNGPAQVPVCSDPDPCLLAQARSMDPLDVETNVDSLDADISLFLSQNEPVKATAKAKCRAKAKAKAGAAAPVDTEEGLVLADPAAKSRGAKRKNAAGGAGGNSKGFKVCKGCGQRIPLQDCAPNFPGDWKCKRALDNIWRLAVKQGAKAMKFVKEQREDPDRCQAMVSSYLESCPETVESARGQKRGQWSLTRYEERVTAASGMVRDKVGEMMNKKLYLEFAGTTRGGKKSDEQSEAVWAGWEERVAMKDPDIIFDNKGENGALRIWVHTGDEVRFRSSYMHEKAVINEGESLKKATAEDQDRLKKRILTKHENVQDDLAVRQALASNAELAFQGEDGFLVDVMQLCEETLEELEPEEGQGNGGESGEPVPKRGRVDAGPGGPSPEKAKPWVDRDRVVSATLRSASQQCKLFKGKAETNLKRFREKLAEFQQCEMPAFQSNFRGELKIFENRVQALGLVVERPLVDGETNCVTYCAGKHS